MEKCSRKILEIEQLLQEEAMIIANKHRIKARLVPLWARLRRNIRLNPNIAGNFKSLLESVVASEFEADSPQEADSGPV